MRPRASRHSTRSTIVLTSRGMGRHFLVTNVSRTGAGLRGEKQLNVGEGVTINFAGGRIDAIVKWAKKDVAGVAFERELGPQDFNQLMTAAYIPQHNRSQRWAH